MSCTCYKFPEIVKKKVIMTTLIIVADSSECVEGEKDSVCSCQCLSLHLPGQQWSCLHLWQGQRTAGPWRRQDQDSPHQSTEFRGKNNITVFLLKIRPF